MGKFWRNFQVDWNDDWRGVGINPTPILIHTLSGWAGVSAIWYGVSLATAGNNQVAVPWLVIGSLLGITSLWTDINNRIERSRAWNRWLNEEHGQIREAQSINADEVLKSVDDLRDELIRRIEMCEGQIDDVAESSQNREKEMVASINRFEDWAASNARLDSDRMVFDRRIKDLSTEVHSRIDDIEREHSRTISEAYDNSLRRIDDVDRALGELSRSCEKNCKK